MKGKARILFVFIAVFSLLLGCNKKEAKIAVETEGVFGAGNLSNGSSVIWRTDADENRFVYVEERVKNAQIAKHIGKLKENAISYEEFKRTYER